MSSLTFFVANDLTVIERLARFLLKEDLMQETIHRFLTEKEVASELRVSVRTVLRRIEDGTLRAIRVGKFWRIERPDLEAYLQLGDEWPDRNKVK